MKIVIKEKCPSLNMIYGGVHWSKRKKIADFWHELVYYAVKQSPDYAKLKSFIPLNKAIVDFVINYTDNRRHDPDNAIFGIKMVLDGLVMAGVLKDDDSEHLQIGKIEIKKQQPENEVVVEVKMLYNKDS